jgi:hypothetical protein
MAFGGAVVHDPVAAAARLAELFGHGVSFIDDAAPPGAPVAGVSMGDIPVVLYPVPDAAESERLWGRRYSRPQTCNVGVHVADLTEARRSLAHAGVPIHRDGGDHLVLAPELTGGVTLVVVDDRTRT